MNEVFNNLELFSKYANEYNDQFGDLKRFNQILDNFYDICIKQNTLLDLGCGPGNVASYFKKKNKNIKITCVDFSKEMLNIAKEKIPDASFILSDIRKLPCFENKFQIIICAFAIPYLKNNEVSNLIEKLKVLSESNAKLLISFMEGTSSGYEVMGFADHNKTHVERHEKKSIIFEFEKNGFILVKEIIEDYIEPDGSITKDIVLYLEKCN